jgi:hypothetical protein
MTTSNIQVRRVQMPSGWEGPVNSPKEEYGSVRQGLRLSEKKDPRWTLRINA